MYDDFGSKTSSNDIQAEYLELLERLLPPDIYEAIFRFLTAESTSLCDEDSNKEGTRIFE